MRTDDDAPISEKSHVLAVEPIDYYIEFNEHNFRIFHKIIKLKQKLLNIKEERIIFLESNIEALEAKLKLLQKEKNGVPTHIDNNQENVCAKHKPAEPQPTSPLPLHLNKRAENSVLYSGIYRSICSKLKMI